MVPYFFTFFHSQQAWQRNKSSFTLQISTPIHCWFLSQRKKHLWNISLLSSTVKRALKSVDGRGTVAFISNFRPAYACESHSVMCETNTSRRSEDSIALILISEIQFTVIESETTRLYNMRTWGNAQNFDRPIDA